jgi:hypothetical protein
MRLTLALAAWGCMAVGGIAQAQSGCGREAQSPYEWALMVNGACPIVVDPTEYPVVCTFTGQHGCQSCPAGYLWGADDKCHRDPQTAVRPVSEICAGGAPPKNGPDCVPAFRIAMTISEGQPLPLTCPKYQHVFHWPGSCGPSQCDEKNGNCYAVCAPVPADKCVDDVREVTEREWQELMKRPEALESIPVTVSNAATQWPEIASVQLVITSAQAALKGNENVKQCGPGNHAGVCFDPGLHSITNRIYSRGKDYCEAHEGVICTQIIEGWVPVGKPVFYDELK